MGRQKFCGGRLRFYTERLFGLDRRHFKHAGRLMELAGRQFEDAVRLLSQIRRTEKCVGRLCEWDRRTIFYTVT
jgi:hypothetical protein